MQRVYKSKTLLSYYTVGFVLIVNSFQEIIKECDKNR